MIRTRRKVSLEATRTISLETAEGTWISLDLVWLPSDGGETTLNVPARGRGTPHFGPENDRIYFYSSKGLVSLRYDGTDRRTHAKILGKKREGGGEPEPADEVQISPNGKWARAKVSNLADLVILEKTLGLIFGIRTPSASS